MVPMLVAMTMMRRNNVGIRPLKRFMRIGESAFTHK